MKLSSNSAAAFFCSFLAKLNIYKNPITIEQLVNKLSEEVDEIIIKTSRETQLHFIGGKLELEFIKGKILAAIDLFFLDDNEEWVKHALRKQIADKLNPKELNELKQGSLTFDIAPPETAI
ncbi:TPA: hypothetical protein G9C53_004904 [Salmonella enterica subsp. enterica serovar Typhimurium var. 5-]|uniref:Uncharacterized protein n=1 Tax=Salmonella enterica subsp. enterica serovar Typhimurium var. 5- TaxID=1620419 RepID=A0A740PU49_SALTM|nr:hypothetical protein [Salmonella enterica subsp. enterica serovar Typhimurium var. 5-]